MLIPFFKMNGLGNDYVFFNLINQQNLFPLIQKNIEFLSDRHFGVGGDGVIVIQESQIADVKMRIFNNDGLEGHMCGNGIRELAKLVWDKNIVRKNPLTVETLSGIRTLDLTIENDKVSFVSVNMGMLDFNPESVPFNSPDNAQEKGVFTFSYQYVQKRFGETSPRIQNITFYTGSAGTKHAACFLKEDVENFDFLSVGKEIEFNAKLFPERVNVEFVNIISPTKLKMRVWERGAGHTLACGTGATFIVGLAMKLGLIDSSKIIEVQLERGSLFISQLKSGSMIMQGGADLVFEGSIELNL